jgi:hypothetical protein
MVARTEAMTRTAQTLSPLPSYTVDEPIDTTDIRWHFDEPTVNKGLFDPEITVGVMELDEVRKLWGLGADDDDAETQRLPEIGLGRRLDDYDDDPTTPWRVEEVTVVSRRRARMRARRTSRWAMLGYLAAAASVLGAAILFAGLPPTLGSGPPEYQALDVRVDLGWVQARLSAALDAEIDPAVGMGALELGQRFAQAPRVPILGSGRVQYSVAAR